MKFNAKKCKHMRHGKNHPNQPYTMKSGQERIQIEQVKVEKDLGVIFDEKLLFREHISKKSAIANRNLGLIFKSFTYLNKENVYVLIKNPRATALGVCYTNVGSLRLPSLEYRRLRADVIEVYKIIKQNRQSFNKQVLHNCR